MTPPLRVGIVHYLNSRPLAWGFRRGQLGGGFDVRYLPPAAVADGLATAQLDVGLVPAIELQRIPGLRALPGPCVAATREVRSVLLISRRELGEIRRVSLDENSRTSAVLVRILLRETYGVDAEYLQAPAELDAMLARADAALLIGDPALRVDRSAYRVLDLAAEWRRLTGHPFVFALWAARDGVTRPQLARPFRDSLSMGLSEMVELIDEAAAETGLGVDELERYLTRNLSFLLGDEEQAGLEEFHRRAHAHGLIPELRPLQFLAD
ncbi:MAG: menaquinone biosynthetic enzyme MqnA/MqnD family protein [Thermoanaerobaculia bacterium]